MAETMELPCPTTPSRGSTRASRIRTPPAPQFGYSDNFEPYSPRKSSRIAQRVSDQTPSPKFSTRSISEKQQQQPKQRNPQASPKTTRKQVSISTPLLSPQKKKIPAMDSSRRASGTLTTSGAATAAAALGLPALSRPELLAARATTSTTSASMLITPAKTPVKPPTEQSKAKVEAFARTLFRSEEEIMPSPRKVRGKKYTLDSFTEEASEESIHIFTDSHERIPEVDRSIDNPFYGAPPRPAARTAPDAPRRSRRQMVSIPGEGKISVDEAIQRDDGMVTVFRGKKQFRKFVTDDGLDEEGGLESAVETHRQHLTRSAIKPRLLFPTAKAKVPEMSIEDEEALTDIEDHVLAGINAEDEPVTPAEPVGKTPGTPEAPKFAPASPPTTVRTTRVTKKTLDAPKPRATGRSPFDSWKRTKGSSSSADSTSHKRPGDDLSAGPSKRTRA